MPRAKKTVTEQEAPKEGDFADYGDFIAAKNAATPTETPADVTENADSDTTEGEDATENENSDTQEDQTK